MPVDSMIHPKHSIINYKSLGPWEWFSVLLCCLHRLPLFWLRISQGFWHRGRSQGLLLNHCIKNLSSSHQPNISQGPQHLSHHISPIHLGTMVSTEGTLNWLAIWIAICIGVSISWIVICAAMWIICKTIFQMIMGMIMGTIHWELISNDLDFFMVWMIEQISVLLFLDEKSLHCHSIVEQNAW